MEITSIIAAVLILQGWMDSLKTPSAYRDDDID